MMHPIAEGQLRDHLLRIIMPWIWSCSWRIAPEYLKRLLVGGLKKCSKSTVEAK